MLLDSKEGVDALLAYYEPYVRLARERRVGLLLDTPTWRASSEWGSRLGYDDAALADVNRRAVALLERVRAGAGSEPEIVISGCVGPRRDAYRADDAMSEREAEEYHSPQLATLAETSADLLSALTLTNAAEAVGIARAADQVGLPVAISFTVETDGRLPSGQPLGTAIEEVEENTSGSVAYFMVNCAHPTHFSGVLSGAGAWRERIRGIRANASAKSHAELDESNELDDGDPLELAERYVELAALLPAMTIVGGCCGTDHRHVDAISAALHGRRAAAAATSDDGG